jgi:hypothetical protein
VICAFSSEIAAFSAVKAEVSVDRAAFSVEIAAVNAFTATITTHRAASNVLMSNATTVKSAFTGEKAAFTRDKATITGEDVTLSHAALEAAVLAAPFTRAIEARCGSSEGLCFAIVRPHLLIPVRVRIPDDSGRKSTEPLSSVCTGGTRRRGLLTREA